MCANAQDSGGVFGVLAEETVLVTDLHHEEDVGVFGFEVKDLLFEGSVGWGFGRGSGVLLRGGRFEKLLEEALVE